MLHGSPNIHDVEISRDAAFVLQSCCILAEQKDSAGIARMQVCATNMTNTFFFFFFLQTACRNAKNARLEMEGPIFTAALTRSFAY